MMGNRRFLRFPNRANLARFGVEAQAHPDTRQQGHAHTCAHERIRTCARAWACAHARRCAKTHEDSGRRAKTRPRAKEPKRQGAQAPSFGWPVELTVAIAAPFSATPRWAHHELLPLGSDLSWAQGDGVAKAGQVRPHRRQGLHRLWGRRAAPGALEGHRRRRATGRWGHRDVLGGRVGRLGRVHLSVYVRVNLGVRVCIGVGVGVGVGWASGRVWVWVWA